MGVSLPLLRHSLSGEACRRVRFICEWCHESVSIVEGQKPYGEVLAHFSSCSRRAPVTTDEQVAGLADHIARLIVEREREEEKMRRTG
jgi:hypothetical protein